MRELTNARELQELYNNSCWTWEGMSIDEKSINTIKKMLKLSDKNELLYFKGKLMNKVYSLTGDNRYNDDLTFLSVTNYYDAIKKIVCEARWFDDIVDNNRMKECEYSGE